VVSTQKTHKLGVCRSSDKQTWVRSAVNDVLCLNHVGGGRKLGSGGEGGKRKGKSDFRPSGGKRIQTHEPPRRERDITAAKEKRAQTRIFKKRDQAKGAQRYRGPKKKKKKKKTQKKAKDGKRKTLPIIHGCAGDQRLSEPRSRCREMKTGSAGEGKRGILEIKRSGLAREFLLSQPANNAP